MSIAWIPMSISGPPPASAGSVNHPDGPQSGVDAPSVHAHEAPVLTRGDAVAQRDHVGVMPSLVTDRERAVGSARSLDHPVGVGDGRGYRLVDQDMLAVVERVGRPVPTVGARFPA